MEECSESVISESLSKAWVPTWNEAEHSEPTLTYSRRKETPHLPSRKASARAILAIQWTAVVYAFPFGVWGWGVCCESREQYI